MRISDWSSDVCSSDLPDMIGAPAATLLFLRGERAGRPCWLALPADASGVSIAATALTDATRTLGPVTLDGVTVDEDALLLAEDPAALDDHLPIGRASGRGRVGQNE